MADLGVSRASVYRALTLEVAYDKFSAADLAVVIMQMASLDEHHIWTWVPIVTEDGRFDVEMLAKVLNTNNVVDGEHGWVLLYDVTHPVLALTEDRHLHFGGSSQELPDDPWDALDRVLFVADAVKHSIA